jgi:hypothetical protein
MNTTLDIPSYWILVMNFIVIDKILLSTFLAIGILEIFLSKINNAQSIIWNQNALAMWARGVNRMHALLFLHMHFITDSPLYGEEYKNYFIHNTKHFNRTSYCSASTIMIF